MRKEVKRHVKTAVIGSAMVAIAGTASANILIAITSATQYNYIVHKVPNSDGVVDGIDLGILLNLWGPCPN